MVGNILTLLDAWKASLSAFSAELSQIEISRADHKIAVGQTIEITPTGEDKPAGRF
jgi:hypothetical protein